MHGTKRSKGWRAVVVAAGLAWARGSAAQEGAPAVSPMFCADVVIEESVVDARGAVVEARPQTRYRVVRRRSRRRYRDRDDVRAGSALRQGAAGRSAQRQAHRARPAVRARACLRRFGRARRPHSTTAAVAAIAGKHEAGVVVRGSRRARRGRPR